MTLEEELEAVQLDIYAAHKTILSFKHYHKRKPPSGVVKVMANLEVKEAEIKAKIAKKAGKKKSTKKKD